MIKEFILVLILFAAVAPDSTAATETPEANSTSESPTVNTTTTAASTDSPEANSTTEKPADATTTAASTEVTSTESPAENSTSVSPTESPAENSTSVSPTDSPAANSTTETPTNSTAATAPSTGSTTTPPPTAPPKNPCDPNPCLDGSTCQPLFNHTFTCLCRPGDSYDLGSGVCRRAKVFPGNLNINSIVFVPEMEDKTSELFQSIAKKITSEIDESFQASSSYSGSVVLALRPLQNDGSRTGSGISAEVEILFSETSDVTAEYVNQIVTNNVTCETCAFQGKFESKDLCASKPCDEKSSTCAGVEGGFVCNCIEGHIKTSLTDRMCIACVDSKKSNETYCEPCPIGYSGFNCVDKWEFLLIIIAPILGVLLLITVIVLIVMSCKSKKSSKRSKNEDVVKPYVSHSPAKAPLVNGNLSNGATHSINGQANFGAPRIPRATATATNGWESRTNLEMTPSNSRQNLIPAGPNSYQTRPQTNPYAQSGPQSSSYGQNRNPYAEIRGHSNPYFTSDDGRRLN